MDPKPMIYLRLSTKVGLICGRRQLKLSDAGELHPPQSQNCQLKTIAIPVTSSPIRSCQSSLPPLQWRIGEHANASLQESWGWFQPVVIPCCIGGPEAPI
jgi:hypothetical protein